MKKTVMGMTLILSSIFVLLLSFLFLTVKGPFYVIMLSAFVLFVVGLNNVIEGYKQI